MQNPDHHHSCVLVVLTGGSAHCRGHSKFDSQDFREFFDQRWKFSICMFHLFFKIVAARPSLLSSSLRMTFPFSLLIQTLGLSFIFPHVLSLIIQSSSNSLFFFIVVFVSSHHISIRSPDSKSRSKMWTRTSTQPVTHVVFTKTFCPAAFFVEGLVLPHPMHMTFCPSTMDIAIVIVVSCVLVICPIDTNLIV